MNYYYCYLFNCYYCYYYYYFTFQGFALCSQEHKPENFPEKSAKLRAAPGAAVEPWGDARGQF